MSYLYELHYHTPYTSLCGNIGPEEALPKYKEAGYSGIVVTDHFYKDWFTRLDNMTWNDKIGLWLKGYNKAYETGKSIGLNIILGMEIRFNDNINDHLVFGFDEEFLRDNIELYEMTYEEFGDLCKANKLFFAQAHPFRNVCSPRDPKHLDGVEIYNGNLRWDSHNDIAEKFADENELFKISGSDFHEWEDLCRGGTYLNDNPKDSKELAEMIFNGGIVDYKRTL